MGYSNSKLVSYTKLSPNNSGERNHAIDTITIHCVVGQCSVETLGDIFEPTSRQASCNYGIGSDGRIGLYCEEKNRSWCTSSSSNDNRAITIEVASDTTDPYAVRDVVYESLIKLVADICKRNKIKKLLWQADKSLIGQVDKQNMTVHRWFKNKSCPGEFLYSRHEDIANRVNEILGTASKTVKEETKVETVKSGVVDIEDIKVRVTCDELNIRSGPGTGYSKVGAIKDRGVYTITHASADKDWGKLKSGAGWIHLGYTKKV